MIKIITAMNDPNLNEELKNEENIELICKDIQYKEGILEILENNIEINYIIIDSNLPGEIEIEKLIEKIIEKNEKLKIIITIKKENKNNFNLNNKKIIKIYYQNKINLNKIKNYKKNSEKINIEKQKNNIYKNKKINTNNLKNIIKKVKVKNIIKYNKYKLKNKKREKVINNKSKIITILGDRKVGKSMTIINFAYYLSSKNYKIILVELNEESPSIYTILGCKKFNIKIRKNKKRLKKKYKKIRGRFLVQYLNEKIIENKIIKINKNIDIISYNKLINFNFIKKLKNKYNILLIEIYSKKNKIINKKIIKNSDKNILIIKPNLLGIKNSKKIIEKNKLYFLNNLKIIINNYNKYSIDEKIIKKIFNKNNIVGKIRYKNIYENLINKNFKINILNLNFIEKEIKKILEKIS